MAETNGITSSAPPKPQTSDSSPPAPAASATVATTSDPTFPSTSISDIGLSKRPRDARLIHLILANLGVNAYQERVPLQLMDLAYRYTSSTLQDAVHLASEAYAPSGPGSKPSAVNADLNAVTLQSLRLAIGSRTHYQFNPQLPKETYQELAQERNRIALPPISKDTGLKLPPERYCLTGVGWSLKEEWESEGEEEVEEVQSKNGGDLVMKDGDEEEEEAVDEEDGRMEDFFGEDEVADEDKDMEG
jgi:transcription initiation factor TFIID subunit 9B